MSDDEKLRKERERAEAAEKEAEQAKRDLRAAQRGQGGGSLWDIFGAIGTIFNTVLIGGIVLATAGAIAQIPGVQNWMKETLADAGPGVKVFIDNWLNWGKKDEASDLLFPGAREEYFIEHASQQQAADLVENALSGADDFMLGSNAIRRMVGTKDSPVRKEFAALIKQAGFDFDTLNRQQMNDEKLEQLFMTALTNPDYHTLANEALTGMIADIDAMQAGDNEAGVQKLLAIFRGDGKNFLINDPDVMAAVLQNESLAGTGLILAGILSEDPQLRETLETNRDIIVPIMQQMEKNEPGSPAKLIEALQDGASLESLMQDERFKPAREALFDQILADNSIEENLTAQQLQMLGLASSETPDAVAKFTVDYLKSESDVASVTNNPELKNLSNLDHTILALRGQYIRRTAGESEGTIVDMTPEQKAHVEFGLQIALGGDGTPPEDMDPALIGATMAPVLVNMNADSVTDQWNALVEKVATDEGQKAMLTVSETEKSDQDTVVGVEGATDGKTMLGFMGAMHKAATTQR